MTGSYRGACFCGAVELRVTGQPNAMGYCHCRSCRSWSGSPVNAFTLWPTEAVGGLKGAENIGIYHKTEFSHRQFCTELAREMSAEEIAAAQREGRLFLTRH